MSDKKIDFDPTKRSIITASHGISNVYNLDTPKERQVLIDTLDTCIDILKKHCGPTSGYAMKIEDLSIDNTFKPNVFTRDGIGILAAVEFMSPLERYIKNLIGYVGARVDSAVHDGTTTSMLFSALFMKHMLTHGQDFSNGSFYKFNKIAEQEFNAFIEKVKHDYGYTLEDLANDPELDLATKMQIGGRIAFMQALTSSGGNLELASAMKQIFENSPPSTWEYITSFNSSKETGKSFKVEIEKYDQRIKCISTSTACFNAAMHTEFIADDVTLFIYPDAFADQSTLSTVVAKWLENFDPNKTLVIVAQAYSGSISSLIDFLNGKRNKPIVAFQFAPEEYIGGEPIPWELMVLAATCGVTPLTENDRQMLPSAYTTVKHVYFHDTYLEITGAVEIDDKVGCLHPYYIHPEMATQFYKDLLEETQKHLDMIKNGHRPDDIKMHMFSEAIYRLTTVHRPTLRLGGPAHEQIANRDVVRDVQGATMSSLKHGFTIAGPCALFLVAAAIDTQPIEDSENVYGKWRKILRQTLVTAFSEIAKASLNIKTDEEFNEFLTKIGIERDQYQNVLSGFDHTFSFKQFYQDAFEAQKEGREIDEIQLEEEYPILQPLNTIVELFKRTTELLLKFALTNQFIVAGGMVVKEDIGEK